jgi:S-formylglutathione hydrolase
VKNAKAGQVQYRTDKAGIVHATLGRASFEAAALRAGQPLIMRRHPGFDHGYFFIQSVVDEHLRHHAGAWGVLAG